MTTNKSTPAVSPGQGRPRDQASREAILQAAFAILESNGYSALAFEAVARHAGAGKTTIYRWWPSRAALAVDAFFTRTVGELAFKETGTAAGDFRDQLHRLAALLRSPRGSVLAALMIGGRTDPDLARSIDEQWVAPRRAWGYARMERAEAGGELVSALHIPTALDLLYSPLYAHVLLGAGVHTRAQIEAHCNFLFPAIFKA